jgi:aspartyl-tRNA(Asn)/glutamyl-tRNA(Gln) amidotransferase subunit A
VNDFAVHCRASLRREGSAERRGPNHDWGAKPFAAQVFDYDATVLTKLGRTGAILTGKLAMVQLAGGGGYRFAAASLFGAGLNPWDRTRWSGGSSSGVGKRSRCRARAVCAGLGDVGFHPHASRVLRRHGTPSDIRPGQPSRRHAAVLDHGQDWPHVPQCRRLRHRAARHCGQGRERSRHSGQSFYFAPQFQRDLKTLRVGYAPVDFDEWAEPADASRVSGSTGCVAEPGRNTGGRPSSRPTVWTRSRAPSSPRKGRRSSKN